MTTNNIPWRLAVAQPLTPLSDQYITDTVIGMNTAKDTTGDTAVQSLPFGGTEGQKNGVGATDEQLVMLGEIVVSRLDHLGRDIRYMDRRSLLVLPLCL